MAGSLPESIRLALPAEPPVIAELRHRAADFAAEAGGGQQLVADVALAVSEAVTNVCKHAYESSEAGEVEFTASSKCDWLEISVADQGRGLGVRSEGGMGMGLAIIAKMCDVLHITQGYSGIELQMRFRLRPDISATGRGCRR